MPINNLLFVKTNERRGGFVRNIHMKRVTATTIAGSILAVETDVLYQWRTLLPTYVRKLTPIQGLFVEDVSVGRAKSLCSIKAEAEMPVRNVRLRHMSATTIIGQPIVTDNVIGFTCSA